MEQRRFWPRRASFKRPRRVKKIELSERGIYEPVQSEQNVVDAVTEFLWRCGIPVFVQPERVPYCWNCKSQVCKPSPAGHPDLHGWIPVRSLIRWAKDEAMSEWAKAHVKFPAPFYIEMKRPKGGRHRPTQTEFILRAVDDGVLAFFARSVTEVRNAFAAIGVVLPNPGEIT